MPEIKTVRVVNVSDLFDADDLELFQNEIENKWTWGYTTMSLVPVDDVRNIAFDLSILSVELGSMERDIFVDLNN